MHDSSTPPDLRLRRLIHELNTPVGVCAMAASILPAHTDCILGELDEATLQRIATQVDEWREALALVQSSLQLCVQVLCNCTRELATDGPESLPPIDLHATLQQAVSLNLARRPEVQVSCHMHLSDPLLVQGDRGSWQQVVGNLVANSLVHGFEGRSQGTIQIAVTRLPGNRLLLHYYDDGVGLTPEAHARLYEDGFSTRIGKGGHGLGLGLGMGIVRDLVHNKIGGRLEVHKPAKGVHISIESPC